MSNPLEDAVSEIAEQMDKADGRPVGPPRVWNVDTNSARSDLDGITFSERTDVP